MDDDSPYKPPQSNLIDEGGEPIVRKGRYVVHERGAKWPSRCIKCNISTEQKKATKLVYVNPWIYLSILISPILTIILALIFQKKFDVELPVCQEHLKKRKRFLVMQWVILLLMITGFVVGIGLESGVVVAIALFLVLVVVVMAIFSRLAVASKFKNERLWISGAGKQFLDSLPEYEK